MSACPVVHVWTDDFGDYVIPPILAETTKFRKDGWPDARYKLRNRPFALWLESISPRYAITTKGREMLRGR